MSNPLQWEFPGGKILKDESEENALIRELDEELSINVVPLRRFNSVIYTYSKFTIELIPFECKIISGQINLHEHKNLQWIGKNELKNYNWCAADILLLDLVETLLV